MTELNKRARDLIAAVGDGGGPTRAERELLQAAVLARVGVTGAVGSAVTAASTHAKAAIALSSLSDSAVASGVGASAVAKGSLVGFSIPLVIKGLAAVAVIGLGTAAYVAMPVRLPPAPPVAPSLTANAAAATLSIPATREPAMAASPWVVEAPPAPATPSSPNRAAPSVPAATRDLVNPSGAARSPSLDDEAVGLGAALAALRDRRPAEAISLLDAQDSQFERGALGEERAAARIDALCLLGRQTEAETAAARFLSDHPRSVLAPRVRSSCGVASHR